MQRRWVWFTHQANQDDDAFSMLACIETIASACAFLFIIINYEWSAVLIMSAYITPLFFLRSPESQKSTKEYFERAINRPHRFMLYGIMVTFWLSSYEAPIWMWFFAIPIGGYAIGILYNAWYVQFSSSIFYGKEGFSCLSRNYFKTLFVTDITTRPELFPDSDSVDAIPHWKDSIFFFPQPRTPYTFALSVMLTLPLLGAVLLRFFSKATALIYLPLIYISWPSRLLNDHEEQLIWVRSQSSKAIELFRLWLSVSIVMLFAFSVIEASNFFHMQELVSADNPVRVAAALYYVTNLSDIRHWQLISLINAVLSIGLYFLMDGCRKEANVGRKEFHWRIPIIVSGLRIRSMLSILWIVVIAYFTLEFYYRKCAFSESVTEVLKLFFAEASCSVQLKMH